MNVPDRSEMKRVNFTFVLWRGTIGGAERFTVDLAAALRQEGAEANVLLLSDDGLLTHHLSEANVPFISLGFRRGREVLRHPRSLERALREQAADIVFVPSIDYLSPTIRLAGFAGPIVGIEHGNLIRIAEAGRFKHWAAVIDRRLATTVLAGEVAVSRYMAQMVQTYPHAPLRLIPHGITIPPVAPPLPPGDALVVGFAGRQVPGKGIDQLLRAVGELAQDSNVRPIRVKIAGGGPLLDFNRALSHALGISDAVEFTGWTNDITSHWRECHIAVAPNDYLAESFCISIAEAMARGRATLATDIGAPPELVRNGETGLVVPAADHRGLAGAIRTYANEPMLVTSHGQAARAVAVQRFSLARTVSQYLGLAESLLGSTANSATGP